MNFNYINLKMGCEDSKESLESKILMLRLKRTAIQKQRKEKIERLKKLIGEEIITEPIPDYLENNNNPNQRENRKIEQKENIFRKNKDFDLDDET